MVSKTTLAPWVAILSSILITEAVSQELRRPLADDVEKLFPQKVYRYSCKALKYQEKPDGRFACKFDLGPVAEGHETREIVDRTLAFIDGSWRFWESPPHSMPF